MSKSKAKGTKLESEVVTYLRQTGWPSAERRALTGTNDQGDITGVPGVTIECKSRNGFFPSEWCDQLDREMANTHDAVGFVVAKRRGTTEVGDYFALMPVHVLVDLLREAGYGT